MQLKNILSFVVVAIAIVAGWALLNNQIQPKKAKDDAEKKRDAQADAKAGKEDPGKKARPKQEKPAEKPAKPPKAVPQEVLTLGADTSKYHLTVGVTTLGGGVRSVMLNKFEAADEEGRRIAQPFLLVPDDGLTPSFLLYLYPDKDPTGPPHALKTLGKLPWKIVTNDARGKAGLKIEADGSEKITFEIADIPDWPDLTIRKTYQLSERSYHIGLTVEIENRRAKKDESKRVIRYQLAGAHGLPVEGKWYTTIYRNAMIGLVDSKGNLSRSMEASRRISLRAGGNRVPENNLGPEAIQYAGVTTQYFASMIVVDREKNKSVLDWARPLLMTTEMKGTVVSVWPDLGQFLLKDDEQNRHLFTLSDQLKKDVPAVLKPDSSVRVAFRIGDDPLVADEVRPGSSAHKSDLDDIAVSVNSEKISLAGGGKRSHSFLLYNGPVKARLLHQFGGEKAVDPKLVDLYEKTLHLNTLTDYHWDNWIGNFSQAIHWTDLVITCTNLMHWLLGLLYNVVPIYGVCIVLLTVIVRGLMFPISRRQALMSQKMQALAPEMKKVQEKYKADPQAKTQAVMELYRRHGVNPLGGCLPLLLQMPIFLGLYYAFQESIFFRLANFLWIDNLAAPDMLIRWGESIPMISTPESQGWILYLGPYFNILPIIAVSLMLVQQKYLTPPPTDDNMAAQMKMMKYMMVFMGLMFYKVAAGLCIYFIATTLWGLTERKLLPKKKLGAIAAPTDTGKAQLKGRKPAKPLNNGDGAFQKVKDWWSEVLKQAKKK